jgi:hypothetical protein
MLLLRVPSHSKSTHGPAGAPFPTAPPSFLLALPPLPRGIEYRVIGKDLVLLDEPADVILDYMRNIIR